MIRHAIVSSGLVSMLAYGLSVTVNASELNLPITAQNKVLGVRIDDLVSVFSKHDSRTC